MGKRRRRYRKRQRRLTRTALFQEDSRWQLEERLAEEEQGRLSRQLLITNLSCNVNAHQLHDYLVKYGQVQRIEIVTKPDKYQANERFSTGRAVVEFEEAAAAQAVLRSTNGGNRFGGYIRAPDISNLRIGADIRVQPKPASPVQAYTAPAGTAGEHRVPARHVTVGSLDPQGLLVVELEAAAFMVTINLPGRCLEVRAQLPLLNRGASAASAHIGAGAATSDDARPALGGGGGGGGNSGGSSGSGGSGGSGGAPGRALPAEGVSEALQDDEKPAPVLEQLRLTLGRPDRAVETVTARLVFPFHCVRRSITLSLAGGAPSLSFTTRQPPRILVPAVSSQQGTSQPRCSRFVWSANGTAAAEDSAFGRDQDTMWALACDTTPGGVIGQCMTYRVQLTTQAAEGLLASSRRLLNRMTDFSLLRSASPTAPPTQCSSASRAGHAVAMLRELLTDRLPFTLGYYVWVLMHSGVATPWQAAQRKFLATLEAAASDPTGTRIACAALAELASIGGPVMGGKPADWLAELVEEARHGERRRRPPAAAAALEYNGLQVPRVHVTPTRIKALPPEVESGNRTVRHFCDSAARHRAQQQAHARDPHVAALDALPFTQEHFLRVSFGDEAGDRMFDHRELPIGLFFARMAHVLAEGVVVNGRRFVFLAYSSSQLKEWSCWMVASPEPRRLPAAEVAAAMRRWMGDALDTEKVPAKCAARLGQCFSTTLDAAGVSPHEHRLIPDVERNGFVFSDGVGRISPAMMAEALRALPHSRHPNGAQVSAIQVRFQGCKGVLSLDPRLAGRQLLLRPSQRKFGSTHPRLEVCQVADWLPAYLNRQVVLMMSHNGVPAEVFLDKLEGMLDKLQRMTTSPAAALAVLPQLGGVDATCQRALLRVLSASAALQLPLDPLQYACLRAVARWHVNDLRTKARLHVEEGATLMGVLDELGVLQEGEVFVQVHPRCASRPQVITGDVVVAKHPVSCPGDVRVVRAVASNLLEDVYTNVVVFSQHGERPLPNMLAGSDLDGDLYSVIWDPTLLPPDSPDPLDFTPATSPQQVDQVTVDLIQQHFINHCKNDNLGMIATWLLAHADAQGAGCNEVSRLAALHSIAVDFPKTGNPAELSLQVIRELAPKLYPHWMEKADKASDHSDSTLGQLYDRVLAHPIAQQLDPRDTSKRAAAADALLDVTLPAADARDGVAGGAASLPARMAQLLPADAAPGSPAWREARAAAEYELRVFESDMFSLINHWHVFDIGELLTGCVSQLRRHQRHQETQRREQLGRALRDLFARRRRAFLVQMLETCLRAPASPALLDDGYGSVEEAVAQWQVRPLYEVEADADTVAPLPATPLGFGGMPHVDSIRQESGVDSVQRLQLAIAYVAAAHSWDEPEEQGDEDEGEWDGEGSETDDDGAAGGGSAHAQEQHTELASIVRLAFAWVVAPEVAVSEAFSAVPASPTPGLQQSVDARLQRTTALSAVQWAAPPTATALTPGVRWLPAGMPRADDNRMARRPALATATRRPLVRSRAPHAAAAARLRCTLHVLHI